MEDYTYHLVPGHERVLGAHMLEVCPSIAAATPSLEIHPLSIGNRDDPVRLRFTAAPGDGVVVGLADMGDRFRLVANEVEVVEPDEPLPRLPVACAVWKPKPDLRTATESWLAAGAPHHTVLSTAIGIDELGGLRRDGAHRARRHRRRRRPPAASPTSCAGARPTTTSPAASDRNRPTTTRSRV